MCFQNHYRGAKDNESVVLVLQGIEEKTRKPFRLYNVPPALFSFENSIEQGVNLLFDDRAEEAIIHDDVLQYQMPKREKPDRVYGLRVTNRLDRLLNWTEDKRSASAGKTIGESLRTSPFRPDGDPIIFPFLTLEAKSEKGSNSFSDIQMQTAFTIYSLLKLQEELRKATGDESQWETGPLV